MKPTWYRLADYPEVRFTATLNSHAPDRESWPTDHGVVVKYADKRGVILPWPALVCHLPALLAECPEAMADVKALIVAIEMPVERQS